MRKSAAEQQEAKVVAFKTDYSGIGQQHLLGSLWNSLKQNELELIQTSWMTYHEHKPHGTSYTHPRETPPQRRQVKIG